MISYSRPHCWFRLTPPLSHWRTRIWISGMSRADLARREREWNLMAQREWQLILRERTA